MFDKDFVQFSDLCRSVESSVSDVYSDVVDLLDMLDDFERCYDGLPSRFLDLKGRLKYALFDLEHVYSTVHASCLITQRVAHLPDIDNDPDICCGNVIL